MFNHRKVRLICSRRWKRILPLYLLLFWGLHAQVTNNGFVNRENVSSSDLNATGFAVYSDIDVNENGYGEIIVFSNNHDGQLRLYEANGDNSYILQSQFDMNDIINDTIPRPHQLLFENVDTDSPKEIIITYTNIANQSVIRIFDVDPVNLQIFEHPVISSVTPGYHPVGIAHIDDSNGNGINEIAVANQDPIDNLRLYEFDGSSFAAIFMLTIDLPMDLDAGHVNTDALTELVVTTVNGLKVYSVDNGTIYENGRIQTNYIDDNMNLMAANVEIQDIDSNGSNEIIVSVWWKYTDNTDQFSILIYEYTRQGRFKRDAASVNGVFNPQTHIYQFQFGDYNNDQCCEIYLTNNYNTLDYIEFTGREGRFSPNSFSSVLNIFSTNQQIMDVKALNATNYLLDNDSYREIVVLTANNFQGPELFVLESETGDETLPVTLTAFTATFRHDHIHLEWITESEVNNAYFILERSEDNVHFTQIERIDGQGNTNQQTIYTVQDYHIAPGRTYYYRLADFDLNGTATYHPGIETTTPLNITSQPELVQNYPNPFNPETTIQISISSSTAAEITSLQVFNTAGQLVKTIYSGELAPGSHSYKWNGTNEQGIHVSSGIYFTRLLTGNIIKTHKMMLIR